jgi:hypothetical protein
VREEAVGGGVDADVGEGDEAAEEAEEGVGDEFPGAGEGAGRGREGGDVAAPGAGDEGGDDGGDDDGAELGGAEFAEDDLDGEERAGDGGVEGGGDAGGGAAADEGAQAAAGHAHGLADARTDGGADLDDGAFAAGGAAAADGDGGGDGLRDGDAAADLAAVEGDGLDDFGDAVALGLGDEEGGDEADEEAAEGGDEGDLPGGDGAEVGEAGFDDAPEAVLEEVDGDVEGDGGESAEEADEGGGEEEEEVFAAAGALDPGAAEAAGPAGEGAQAQAGGFHLFGLGAHGKNQYPISEIQSPTSNGERNRMGWIGAGAAARLREMNPVQGKRIAVDARWVFRELSGIGRYTLELLRQLGERGGAFRFLVLVRDAERREFIEQASGPGGEGEFRIRGAAVRGFRLARAVRGGAAAAGAGDRVYHSTNFMVPLPAFPRRKPHAVKCLCNIHDLIPMVHPEFTPRR